MKVLSRWARNARDFCLLMMGVLTLVSTPNSLAEGLHQTLAYVWSAMLIIAALTCLYGAVREKPMVEVAGCVLAAGAFLTWMTAAITQPGASVTSWVVGWLLLSGAAGQVYRIAEVVNDVRPVEWSSE